ncbi:hypothetical protein SSTU70S_00132 [Stutzerimonas stutzeri]
MELTAHVVQRCSQRGIRKQQIEWLITFGCHTWNRGAKIYFFDRSHFLLLIGSLDNKDRQLAEKVRNCYAVIDDRHVITVGCREAAFCARKPGAHHHRRCDWRHGETWAA